MTFILFLLIAWALGIFILMLSMYITSATMGGVDFGSLGMVIAKAAALMVVVVAVQLLPMPWGFALPIIVWWAGLMLLYRLDFWEARTLVIVNWLLNVLVILGLEVLFFPPKPPSSL